MRHLIFTEAASYDVALLIKNSCFVQSELEKHYMEPLYASGVQRNQVIAFTLDYDDNGKAPAKWQKDYLAHLLPALDRLGVKYLYCADSAFFKTLTGAKKTEPCYGYVMPCKIKGFEHMGVILGMNYQALIYDPDLQSRLTLSVKTLSDVVAGTYVALGQGVIHNAHYPDTLETITEQLDQLLLWPALAVDIETFSLRFNEAGIGTIAFAWDTHNGVSFPVDYEPLPEPIEGMYGKQVINRTVRHLLKDWFTRYEGRLTWHGSTFDLRTLIYQLWMTHPQDYTGLLTGLDVMTRCFDDTKIIAYLATNSTAGNTLGLKYLAHEFAGNWAQDEIKDIRKIPLPVLLQYNLIDTLCTNYVKDRYWTGMVEDDQLELYELLMKPSLKTIIQMELVGMPMVMAEVQKAKTALIETQAKNLETVMHHPVIQSLNQILQTREMEKANAKLKIKQHPIEHFAHVTFNPNSGPQLQVLLYEVMQLPVIDYTDTRQPATGADTLEKLINHTSDTGFQAVLKALISYGQVTKILSSFIPAFEAGFLKADGITYLHGNFHPGGTVSGRLSSSDPNLQNLPSGSVYGKLIKQCFQAAQGKLFVGADFMSLEDRINALLTKDPNKLKVYMGHIVYELTIDGVTHHIRDDSTIVYDGNTMTAEEFYATHCTI